jgi:dienelactone hydrolase
MCFDPDSEPPIMPLAGAAIEHRQVVLEAADGNHLAAFEALPDRPASVGMLVLPDVRGLFSYYEELALRFAEAGVAALAIDYYGRTAGPSRRDASFDFAAHVPRSTWAGLQADVRAAAAHLRASAGVTSLYTVGFCYGGRLSLLLASLPDLALDGVIGFYGWPVGTFRNDMPAPAEMAGSFGSGRIPASRPMTWPPSSRLSCGPVSPTASSPTRARRTPSSIASRRNTPTPPLGRGRRCGPSSGSSRPPTERTNGRRLNRQAAQALRQA